MKQSPAIYWRRQQDLKKLLNKHGEIIAITNVINSKHYSGIVKIDDQNISTSIISSNLKPNVGDKVVGVLRISRKNNKQSLIEYGVKFKLLAN